MSSCGRPFSALSPFRRPLLFSLPISLLPFPFPLASLHAPIIPILRAPFLLFAIFLPHFCTSSATHHTFAQLPPATTIRRLQPHPRSTHVNGSQSCAAGQIEPRPQASRRSQTRTSTNITLRAP